MSLRNQDLLLKVNTILFPPYLTLIYLDDNGTSTPSRSRKSSRDKSSHRDRVPHDIPRTLEPTVIDNEEDEDEDQHHHQKHKNDDYDRDEHKEEDYSHNQGDYSHEQGDSHLYNAEQESQDFGGNSARRASEAAVVWDKIENLLGVC